MNSERIGVLDFATQWIESGEFERQLAECVACPSESQRAGNTGVLTTYLTDHLRPRLQSLGFHCALHANPIENGPPFLVAERIEDSDLVTVLGYGHGDVVDGQTDSWRSGLHPFTLKREGDKLYGRGTADNKGQHLINIGALDAVLKTRGRLGFNARFVFEMGEEIGSPGLDAFVQANPGLLEADLFLASDGPRLQPDTPTVFLGSRGCVNFQLSCSLRQSAHHSGNWGGLLRDPAVTLANAIASICDADGVIDVPQWRPESLTESVRSVLENLPVALPDGPAIDADWGEPGLSAAERVFGWNAFSVLSLLSGMPEAPQNAIAPDAIAHCQLRFVVGTRAADVVPAVRAHLQAKGFPQVKVTQTGDIGFEATRLAPDNKWVSFTTSSIRETTGLDTHVLPNLGGSLPNACFSGLPTVWVPHSYRGCAQHAPDEHTSITLCHQAVRLMAGLYYDLGTGMKRN